MNNAAQKEWWFPVSGCIIKSERLTSDQRFVWLILCSFRDTSTGIAYPSLFTIGKLTGLGRLKVRQAIKDLAKLGFITATPRRAGRMNKGYNFVVKPMDMAEPAFQKHFLRCPVSADPFELAQTGDLMGSPNYIKITTTSLTTESKQLGSSDDEQPGFAQNPIPQSPIRFKGKPLSPEAVRQICEQHNVPDHLTEEWSEDVRNTGTIQGENPTQAFLIGRIEHFERCRTGR